MFEQIEVRAKPEVRGWMIWSTLIGTFMVGLLVGTLLVRRVWDPLEWANVVFLAVIQWRLASPVLKEFKAFVRMKSDSDH